MAAVQPTKGHLTCLETFLIIMTEEGGATGISWVEVKGAATCPTVHRTALITKNHSAKMSVVPSLRKALLAKRVTMGVSHILSLPSRCTPVRLTTCILWLPVLNT